ncbi:MAG: stalk domain-containing protein [Fimbriimonas sp.]
MLCKWVVAGVCLLSALAGAQLTNPYTLEYLVDSSDLVVRASIVEIKPEEVVLQVKETLKGEPLVQLAIVVHPTAAEEQDLEAAREDGRSVVWFATKEGPGYRVGDLVNRTHHLSSVRTRRLMPMSLMGYFIAEEPRLFEAIRKEATAKPGRNDRSITIAAPSWFQIPTVTLPLDERTERLGRAWIRPSAVSSEQRLLGVEVLENFKSEKNIGFLKALVQDSGAIESFRRTSDFKSEAARVLTKWDVSLPPGPAVDVLDPKLIDPRPVRVMVDGVEVKFGKGVSPPRLVGGRAYARACTISAPLRVQMHTYSLAHRSGVTVETPDGDIDLPADSHSVWLPNGVVESPFPARMIGKEGFFPMRWVAERLGAKVKWNAKLRRVEITTS